MWSRELQVYNPSHLCQLKLKLPATFLFKILIIRLQVVQTFLCGVVIHHRAHNYETPHGASNVALHTSTERQQHQHCLWSFAKETCWAVLNFGNCLSCLKWPRWRYWGLTCTYQEIHSPHCCTDEVIAITAEYDSSG